ncbi:alpha/beta fold hydrolase, partial [Streptomyces cinerochromogenes]|uniref:alpha/beta fold hydrolase n=1 Tax=Streptomyces cinerochromogenes TaxID=66422 RepID=UPI0033BE3FDA
TLAEADRSRLARGGILPLSTTDGLTLLDQALNQHQPTLVPIRLDRTALTGTDVPALLSDLVPPAARRRASANAGEDARSLRRRIARLAAGEVEGVIRQLVLSSAALLLGHSGPEAIDADRGFLESGFDSLTATQLRARINAATGLHLPPMVVFDSKTPAQLVQRICAELDEAVSAEATAAEESGAAGSPGGGGGSETLTGLWRAGVLAGDVPKAFAMLRAVADLRPQFTSLAELDSVPGPAALAEGAQGPRLICVATPMAAGGAHQHARLAAHFRGVRSVSALPLPGFGDGERLPATATAAVEAVAEGVLRTAAGEPFVLVGYSSGGVLAYATAHYLEHTGKAQPAGVVLLDSYAVTDHGMPPGFEHMTYRLLDMESTFGPYRSAELSAMSRYFHFLPDFTRDSVKAPVLFVGVEKSFIPETETETETKTETGRNAGDFPKALPWDPSHHFVKASGNHFSLVEEDAEETARIIEDWLRSDVQG